MATFAFALPFSGNSNAADTTTTTTTTMASNEAPSTNAYINGEGAADSSTDDMFDGDVDNASLFGEEGPADAAAEDLRDAGFLRFMNAHLREVAAGQRANQPNSPARQAESPSLDGLDLAAAANGMAPAAAVAGSAPATPLPLPAAPLDDGRRLLPVPERVVPANDALANNAPANGAPAKRPRGRPPGKAAPKPVVYIRCHYGCEGLPKNPRDLRKHMMRVHCLFSTAHQHLEKCTTCGRSVDRSIKELVCNKGSCKTPEGDVHRRLFMTAPRDAQEEADTFAYENSGPKNKGPSRLVRVEEGDDEVEWRKACEDAINSWVAGAPVDPAQFNHGLMTPPGTPSPANNQAVVDLTSDDEPVPATPTPAYAGKGKGRTMDYPAVNLAGNNMQLPSLPKKRAADSEPEGEPVAKRTVRNASHDEAEAFVVPDPAPEDTDVGNLLDGMLAEHEADFPEGDLGVASGVDLPQQAQHAPEIAKADDILDGMLATHDADFPEGDLEVVNNDFHFPQQAQNAPAGFADSAFAGDEDAFSLGFDYDALQGFDFSL